MSDLSGVFSWAGVHHGFNDDFKRVSAGHEVNDFEGVSQDSDSKSLLTGVSTGEHECIDESLDDWALSLSEFLDLPSTSSVRDIDLGLESADGDVILEADILDLDFRVVPSAEKLSSGGVLSGGWGDLSGLSDFVLNFYRFTGVSCVKAV